jgi:hypothetical protein
MTRVKILVLTASLLAPLSLIAAAPGMAQAPAAASPGDGAGRHHGRQLLSFLTPEQRVAYRMQTRKEAREQRRAFRKEHFQKLAAMTEGDRQKLKADMQARWDAIPADRKARIQERLAHRHTPR